MHTVTSTDASTIAYHRRGRGDSTEAGPFAVEREIEDIAVLIGEKSPAGLQKGSRELAAVLRNARLEVLPGVSHRLKVKVLAPVLAEFLGENGENVQPGYGSTTTAQR